MSAGTMVLEFQLNGRPMSVPILQCETLAEVIRERLGLTGTKVSCDVQVCGACTVLIDGLPVSACSTLAYEARGRVVTTIEGLADSDGTLDPIQQAFVDEFAFQCGFCTPGMILAVKALLDDRPDPTDAETVAALDGNICRCTGYLQILKAVRAARSLRSAR